MKSIITTIALLVGASSAMAQTGQGSIVTSAYYGFPNILKLAAEAIFEDSTNINSLSISGQGPFGVRGEYFVADKLSVGLDVVYNAFTISYIGQGQTTDNNGNPVMYDYLIKSAKVGVMPYLNYHFIQTGTVDFFGHFGAGYKNRTLSVRTMDPNYNQEAVSTTVIPIALRVGLGVRYFFLPGFGAHMNIGIGHSGLINTGLTFSF